MWRKGVPSQPRAPGFWPAALIRGQTHVSNPAVSKLWNGDRDMARTGMSTEEIIAATREAEVWIGQGETVGRICRSLGVSEQPQVQMAA